MTTYGFPDPVESRIFCVFKDFKMEDIEIQKETYEQIRDLSYHAPVVVEDKRGRILFEGKRGEIIRFKHIYPEDKVVDEREMNSHLYGIEKAKRDKFWNELLPTLSRDQKDEVWSIIYARWGDSYAKGIAQGTQLAWKSFFRNMFRIISLELAGYSDGLSSKDGIIAKWSNSLEIPDMYGNIELFRKTITHGKEVHMSELPQGSEEGEKQ